jgi:phosphoribulokinase
MAERDPRLDPKAGDLILIGKTFLECTARGRGRSWRMVYAIEETLTWGHVASNMDYRTWRNLARDSRIIHAAD